MDHEVPPRRLGQPLADRAIEAVENGEGDGIVTVTVTGAPEYNTTAGEFLQLFANEIEGQRTMEVAFTEKLRAHPIKIELSSFKQKKSQGTWGAIIYRPIFVAAMLGV